MPQLDIFSGLDLSSSTNYKFDSIDELNSACLGCKKCELHQSRNSVVVGKGNSNKPLIMLIGEAPGKTEDEQGVPFIGPSGALIREIIANFGIADEQIYFTNAVRCKPDNLKSNQINCCNLYLKAEIQIVKPQALILLGKVAYLSLIESKQNFSKIKDKINYYLGIPYITVYHPAFLLRNPSLEVNSPKWQTWIALAKFINFIQQ